MPIGVASDYLRASKAEGWTVPSKEPLTTQHLLLLIRLPALQLSILNLTRCVSLAVKSSELFLNALHLVSIGLKVTVCCL